LNYDAGGFLPAFFRPKAALLFIRPGRHRFHIRLSSLRRLLVIDIGLPALRPTHNTAFDFLLRLQIPVSSVQYLQKSSDGPLKSGTFNGAAHEWQSLSIFSSGVKGLFLIVSFH